MIMAHSYTTAQIGKVTLGTNTLAESMIFKTDGPLDDRVALKVPASLISSDALGSKNYVYPAMTCTIESTGDIYILKNKSALNLYTTSAINAMTDAQLQEAIDAAWIRVPNSEDISNLRTSLTQSMQTLAGVFQFKGVAHSVDEDFTVITIKPLTYNDKSYVCTGFYYDLMMTKYYKWESSDSEASPRILFTKDGDATNSIYLFSNDGNERQAIYVEHNGETFYFDFTHNGSTEGVLKFTSLLGNTIYADSNLGLDDIRANNYVPSSTKFYSSATTQTDSGDGATLLFTATPVVYAAYEFIIYGNPAYTGTLGSGVKVFASSKTDDPNNPYNVGHVYQIGEKEYASNGLIWVELGSPKEEITWLVINS